MEELKVNGTSEMLSALDQRLASRFGILWVRTLGITARQARSTGAYYTRLAGDIIGILARPGGGPGAIDRLMRDQFDRARSAITDDFATTAFWSHREAARVLGRTIPRRWFRMLDSRIVEEEGPVLPQPSAEEKTELIQELVFPPPSRERIVDLLMQPGPNGMTWDERLKHWEGPVRERMLGELTQGAALGEGLDALRKRIRPLVGDIRYKAQRIVRTEGRRIAERSQTLAYDQAGDLIGAMQILATLDEHTRPPHRERHGRVYQRQGGQWVSRDGEVMPDLPDEPNCRCWHSPILSSPALLPATPAALPQFENASADLIPDPAAYAQWFAAATRGERATAVGVRRYQVVARRVEELGRFPDWEDFLDETGALAPLERLKGESWADWTARRQAVAELIAAREALFKHAEIAA